MRLQKLSSKKFEKSLDIRSLFKSQLNLTLLIQTLLTKPQQVLFESQRSLVLPSVIKSSSESSSSEDQDHKKSLIELLGFTPVSSCDKNLLLSAIPRVDDHRRKPYPDRSTQSESTNFSMELMVSNHNKIRHEARPEANLPFGHP